MRTAEQVARAFHEAYERLAPDHGWETQERSRKDWDDVPEANRSLMVAVAADLLDRRIITEGATLILDGMYGHDHRPRVH